MKFTLQATIPTTQYGNLQPAIEVEAATFEEAQAIAMPQIQKIWNSVCETGKELVIRDIQSADGAIYDNPTERMTCSLSGEVLFLDNTHTYRDAEGTVYQSGSRYAEQFGYEFNKDAIIPLYANKFGVEPGDVEDFWNLKGDNSRNFGTALHGALEIYGKFTGLASKLSTEDKRVDLGIHPILLPIVEEFFELNTEANSKYELFVVDKKNGRCGQIDRLVITGEKSCIIEDYKTNGNILKQNSPKYLKEPFGRGSPTELLNQPLSIYYLQQNFYREIMESLGWTVDAMRIHTYTTEWETLEVPKIQLP